MRLDIRYHMRFNYDADVREAHNELRVRPRDLPEQRLLAHRLSTVPLARVLSFTDYWGTTVDQFSHVPDHDELEIIADAAVETRSHRSIDSAPTAALHDHDFATSNWEYLRPSAHVEWDDSLADAARQLLSSADDVKAVVAAAVAMTRDLLYYQRDSTHIGITLADLVAGGSGVCQDYAHLAIGLLRAAGVPARYVSGYLFAADETAVDDTATAVDVQTHAWVEAAIPGEGWWPADPTNDRPVGPRHVVIGVGRDYDDVAPVRGVYCGESIPAVQASVEIRRMEAMAHTMSERPRRRATFATIMPTPPDAAIAQQQQQ